MDIKEIKKTIQDLREAAEGATLCQECCTSRRRDNVPMWRDLLRRAARIIEDLSHADMITAVMRPQKIVSRVSFRPERPGTAERECDFLNAQAQLAARIGKSILERAVIVQDYDPAQMRMVLQASVWIYIPEDE